MSNVTKDYIPNKCCSFEHSIHQRILKNKMSVSKHMNMNIDNNHNCFLSSKSSY